MNKNRPVVKCPKCGSDFLRIVEFYNGERVWVVGPHIADNGLRLDHDVTFFKKVGFLPADRI